jgi:hypothetical protein
VRELIATMARDNPRWGSERIRGELLKLGLVFSKRSIQRYRRRGPAHPSSQTWRTFLTNHSHHLWAADLLTVQTLTFKPLYVLIFIAHGRRELVHVNVTANLTAAWVWRQVLEATPWGHKPRHLLHDRDAVYGRDLRRRPPPAARPRPRPPPARRAAGGYRLPSVELQTRAYRPAFCEIPTCSSLGVSSSQPLCLLNIPPLSTFFRTDRRLVHDCPPTCSDSVSVISALVQPLGWSGIDA